MLLLSSLSLLFFLEKQSLYSDEDSGDEFDITDAEIDRILDEAEQEKPQKTGRHTVLLLTKTDVLEILVGIHMYLQKV